MTHGKKWRNALVAGATAALMLSVTPASMADTDKVVSGFTVDASKLNVGAIDANKLVKLTIHKSLPGSSDMQTGVQGVTFEVQRLSGYDLTTVEGWEQALKLTPAKAAEGPFDGAKLVGTTDAAGDAVFADLPIGVYFVHEVRPDNADKTYESSDNFVITLPVGNAEGTAWAYDVPVRAKNQPVTPEPSTPPTTPSTPTKTTTVPPVTVPKLPPETPTKTTTTTTVRTTTPEPAPTPEKSVPRRVQERLASTGANVLGVVGLGAGLVIGGIFLAGRRRKDDEA